MREGLALRGSIDWLSDQSPAKDDSRANGWIHMGVDADVALLAPIDWAESCV